MIRQIYLFFWYSYAFLFYHIKCFYLYWFRPDLNDLSDEELLDYYPAHPDLLLFLMEVQRKQDKEKTQ